MITALNVNAVGVGNITFTLMWIVAQYMQSL